MVFYDFEVFKYDWLVVLADYDKKEFITIVNSTEELNTYFESHKIDIFIGFNNKKYDQFVFKGILTGHNPYKISKHIIDCKQLGFTYTKDFNYIYMINYDVYNTLQHGLKFYEGSMGDNIQESSIPFDIDRKLTDDELKEVISYCRHDVEETIKIFFKKKDDFMAQLGLVKLAREISGKNTASLMPKTQTQLASVILDARPVSYDDEFDIDTPNTLCLEKYSYIKDWYLEPANMNYEKSLTTKVAGLEHNFGFGGLHSLNEKSHFKDNIMIMDVASLYPSLMINYDLLSRAVKNKSSYTDIYSKRLKYKREHNPQQLPLKLVLNKTYGAMKDKNNTLYDPRQANRVCIYGQLLILDLIEHLEPYATLIQTNTDGIFIKYQDKDLEIINDITNEWQSRTKLTLEFTKATEIWQKDVNNYVLVLSDGTLKTKGAYVKHLDPLDYGDFPIINKAIINKLIYNIPVKDTINNSNDLIDFQMVCKLTGKFSSIYYGNQKLNEKCVRIFAGDKSCPGINKQHAETLSLYKISNTPDHVFIDNTDIHNKKTDSRLDRNFYIDLAEKRLNEFI